MTREDLYDLTHSIAELIEDSSGIDVDRLDFHTDMSGLLEKHGVEIEEELTGVCYVCEEEFPNSDLNACLKCPHVFCDNCWGSGICPVCGYDNCTNDFEEEFD